MKRRWIIRSFFIGLLVLCVGGWVGSYWDAGEITYSGRNVWYAAFHWGKLHLMWAYDPARANGGWDAFTRPASADTDAALIAGYGGHYYLGFFLKIGPDENYVAIPFYFPTLISAALLWLVWRKTRPKAKGRAFPVEPSKPIEQGGKAK
jgi:hypothetical protein